MSAREFFCHFSATNIPAKNSSLFWFWLRQVRISAFGLPLTIDCHPRSVELNLQKTFNNPLLTLSSFRNVSCNPPNRNLSGTFVSSPNLRL
jgi:hypothetical protein